MYVKVKIFYNYFNGVSLYSNLGEKSAAKTAIFLEIFQILTLRAAASIFFVLFGLLTYESCAIYTDVTGTVT